MIFNVLLCGATEILALQRFAITNSPSSHPGLLPIFSGVTEIRTRDTLLGYTRFPGACLSSISACITDVYTIRALHLRVICARAAILTFFVGLANSCSVTSYLLCKVTRF